MIAKASTITASHFAAALLGGTALAGLPAAALAQDAATAPAGASETSEAAPATQVAPAAEIIRSIAVSGAQRLEPETIVSYVKLRPGDTYTAAGGDQALKDLAATELFSDYGIRFANGAVVIEVEENPVINRIVLEGNKRLKDDKIRPEINLSARQIFTRSKVRADVARIIELYKRQGRFAASVDPQMVELDQNRVDVVFEITEGPKSKVRKINVLGNQEFSDSKLRGEMVTKEAGLLKILSSNTSYDPDRLAFDQQKLRQFYLTEGYADFRVVSAVAELTPDKRDFIITYVVEEGERYKFSSVEVESQLRDFNSDFLTRALSMKEGDWYNAQSVDDTIEQLTETAGTFGYAFADVRPQFTPDRETRTMGVKFTIGEAPRVYIEAVEVNGNTLTQDKVIRREFRQAEGDAFNSLQVRRSTARINSLGYFQENFEIEQVEGAEQDRIILQANVQEEPTGELSLSAGFSSLESFVFQGSIKQNNFRGRGQTVGLSLNYSRYSKAGSISFTEPYLFDKNIQAGVDIYRRDYNNDYYGNGNASYESSTTGLSARAGVPMNEYLSLIGRYTFNYDEITINENLYFGDFDGDGVRTCEPVIAGRYLCDAIGTHTSSILGFSLVHNSLNNRVRPTRGEMITVSADFAGLGGNTKYLRTTLNARKYWSVGSGFIFSLSAQGGVIKGLGNPAGTSKVRLNDRFFLGEQVGMRGFDIRGVGPRIVRQRYSGSVADGFELLPLDNENNRDDALGGTAYYLGHAELEIPLGSGARELGLRPSLFVDVGSVFDIERPSLVQSPLPNGLFIATRDTDGNALYDQDFNGVQEVVISATAPDGSDNVPRGGFINEGPFVEGFYGDTYKPRLSVGIGINWNSPFGPFRIDIAKVLLSQVGDETKTFSFNVGTQF